MKQLCALALLCGSAFTVTAQSKTAFNDTAYLQPVEIKAVRAGDKAPFALSNLSKKDIQKNNTGQDLPFILGQVPSAVINSDAGNGIGYTGIHIRGIDASRINVTLNGIPYNDAESQGTYFVDLPDIASSANSIQVQRGIGTSTNGAGAFGGTINLSTNEISDKKYIDLDNSYGSFNSWKNTLRFGTGILGHHFTLDARLSHISSDGYIDRAATSLRSFYVSAAWLDQNNSLRLNIFSGKEKTYQAWNGVPEYLLDSARTYNSSGTQKPGTPYDNETDNYIQTHYQLFYNHKFNADWKGNIAVFLTRGKGYYEEYRADQALSDYGLPDYTSGGTTYTSTDLVKRLWLDNYFYGTIFSLQYQKNKTQVIIGGGANAYDGKHYGEITWTQLPGAAPANYRWYNLAAYKKDVSLYGKWSQQINMHWQTFADMQFRYVPYTINGFDDNPAILVKKNYAFFNPKVGITWTNNNWQAYASYALASKEPNRDDFEASVTQQPKPELLNDVELGISKKGHRYSFDANLYYMYYHNQLVLTGKINDVGSYTRTNIPVSYRAGIELQGSVIVNSWLNISANIAFSTNKIKNYTEYLDDYDNGGQQTRFYTNTTIAFSPSVVGGSTLHIAPFKHAGIDLVNKYVSRQYLDNSTIKTRSLHPYFVQDARLTYTIPGKRIHNVDLFFQVYNVFSKYYEPNGYTYSYIENAQVTTENFYFPMAPVNFMGGVSIKL